jgi:hypothetical protein
MTDSPITNYQCDSRADLLDKAISKLVSLGVPVHSQSRLPIASAYLREIGCRTKFPTKVTERKKLLAALRDAAEWHLITISLGGSVTGEFLQDLRGAVAGALVPRAPGNQALQLQAQLFFGAILVQDGKALGAPTTGGFPDFAWKNGTLVHGIEVKAPSASGGVSRAVRTADSQLLRYSGGGMLVLDASLLLDTALAASNRLRAGSASEVEMSVKKELAPLKSELRQQVRRRGSWRRGRGITATALVARVHYWESSEGVACPASTMAVAWRRYYQHRGTLAYWRATALGDRVGSALKSVVPDLSVKWEE